MHSLGHSRDKAIRKEQDIGLRNQEASRECLIPGLPSPRCPLRLAQAI